MVREGLTCPRTRSLHQRHEGGPGFGVATVLSRRRRCKSEAPPLQLHHMRHRLARIGAGGVLGRGAIHRAGRAGAPDPASRGADSCGGRTPDPGRPPSPSPASAERRMRQVRADIGHRHRADRQVVGGDPGGHRCKEHIRSRIGPAQPRPLRPGRAACPVPDHLKPGKIIQHACGGSQPSYATRRFIVQWLRSAPNPACISAASARATARVFRGPLAKARPRGGERQALRRWQGFRALRFRPGCAWWGAVRAGG